MSDFIFYINYIEDIQYRLPSLPMEVNEAPQIRKSIGFGAL